MADTINELYSKYTEGVEGALEEDRYFQYLFEMIQAGDNTLQQKYRVLHKVIDERWLTEVEKGIEAIFNIVDKPRRFITTSEEVVPVALARKITADSVRHLSQNTQFITADASGEIMPTRVLNVTTEESYDLYENRFIYHLIQRLFTFVDKRTDVIFWATGDESCNVMSMESKVDDAYEEISYKVEMTIKNRQSVVENDDNNMELFKRIDRVRRLSRTLRTSSFCDIMNGCAKVRSPIQRTNLMMKDRDYRACYQLWQFIESYDEVGYTIEEQDSALQFDEEYLLQMYINMITNYTVFKSLLESDPRKMKEIATEKREPVKPKFVKEIQEEIVENRDIPDVEIRRVFVEEVTQAQLDAEEKLKEETEKRESLEKDMTHLQWEMDGLNQQLEYLEQMKAQLEEDKLALENSIEVLKQESAKQLEDTKTALQEAADRQLQEEQNRASIELREAKEAAAAELKEEKTRAAAELQAVKEKATSELEAEKNRAASVLQAEKEKSATELEAERNRAATELQAAMEKSAVELETEKSRAASELQSVREIAANELEREKKRAADKLQAVEEKAATELESEKNRAAVEFKTAMEKAASELETEKARAAAELQNVKKTAASELETEKKCATEEIQNLKDTLYEAKKAEELAKEQLKIAEKRTAEAEKEKEKAIAKAEANSLSRYIVNALQERKERKKQDEDEK